MKKLILFISFLILFSTPVTAWQDNRQIGINLGEVKTWSPLWIFVDQMKQSRDWQKADTGWASLYYPDIPVPQRPEDGYPTCSPFVVGDTAYYPFVTMMTDLDNLYPSGAYTLEFDGNGTILLSGDVPDTSVSASGTPVTIQIDTPSSTGVYLTIMTSDSSDPVRNIRFVMPGYAGTYQSDPFYPTFINRLQDFSVVRFMVTTYAHWTDIDSWDSKAGTNFYTQASIDNAGLAYEYIPMICNRVLADAWVNIPYKADDNYVHQMARILYQNLNYPRKVYLEYGNENWSSEYNVYNYTRAQGLNDNLDYAFSGNPDGATDTDLAGWRWSVKRALQVFKIFEDEFGGDNRLVKVLAAQPEWRVIMEVMLDAWQDTVNINPDSIAINGVATSPYYALTMADDIGNAGNSATVTQQEMIDSSLAYMRNQIPGWVQQMKELADSYGLSLYAYEGGIHLKTLTYNNDTTYVNKILGVSRDNQTEAIYKEYFDTWFGNGGGLFMHHDLCSRYDKYNSFGLLEYMDQNTITSPKWQALKNYVFDTTSPKSDTIYGNVALAYSSNRNGGDSGIIITLKKDSAIGDTLAVVIISDTTFYEIERDYSDTLYIEWRLAGYTYDTLTFQINGTDTDLGAKILYGGDIDGDNDIDEDDFTLLSNYINSGSSNLPSGDLDNNGYINITDITFLIENYLKQ